MALSTRYAVALCIISLFLAASCLQSAPFDPKVLDEKINMDLRNTSMSDAIAMVSNAADIWVIAPGEPTSGIILTLNGLTVRQVLDGLAVATGTTWQIRDDIVVFTKSSEPPSKPKDKPKSTEPLTPEQAMTEMIASLNSSQLYALSSGYPIGYADMSPSQRDTLRSLLSSPTVAVDDTGDKVTELPSPEQATIYFATLPYLALPDAEGKARLTLRLDSTPYSYLKRNAK